MYGVSVLHQALPKYLELLEHMCGALVVACTLSGLDLDLPGPGPGPWTIMGWAAGP